VSVTTEPVPSRPTRHERSPVGPRCAQCQAGMAPDQEWCLECGSARTLIHRAPDWRVPVAIVATLLVLMTAGFAVAIIGLSRDANRSAALETIQTTRITIPAATTAAPAAPAAPVAATPAAVAAATATPKRHSH